MINVTKTFLPPFDEYTDILKRAWEKSWLTNNGELVQELEAELKNLLGVKHLLFTTNGTIVLQMALKALNITEEVITTPFSYVATTNAVLWENCTPVFVDIDPATFCIDHRKIEVAITPRTQAILATHVYGYPCDVAAIESIAQQHNLKVIYDAAHAFGTKVAGRSLLSYGDISTCSFHATKLFHTGEGGCIIAQDDEVANALMLYRQFGHIGDQYYTVGINGKNSEFHAAMGICNLKYIDEIMAVRKRQWLHYEQSLQGKDLRTLSVADDIQYNYSYFPVVFNTDEDLSRAIAALNAQDIYPRRYFYPSLNTLPYMDYAPCPVSEEIAGRVICLPLFYDLTVEDQNKIIGLITN